MKSFEMGDVTYVRGKPLQTLDEAPTFLISLLPLFDTSRKFDVVKGTVEFYLNGSVQKNFDIPAQEAFVHVYFSPKTRPANTNEHSKLNP